MARRPDSLLTAIRGRTFIAKPAGSAGVTYSLSGMPFFWDTSERPSNVQPYFEVFIRAVSGTGYARLFDLTVDAPVSGSELSTTLASYQRKRVGPLTLTDQHEYMAQKGKVGSDQVATNGGRMWVVYP